MLSMDRRRAFGQWFFIAVIAYAALYFNDISYIVLDDSGDALATFAMAGSMGMVTYIMPLFASLPFAAGFCADWNSGFTTPAVLRSGKRKYMVSKCLACVTSGGLAAAMGTFVLIAFLNLKFPTTSDVIENYMESEPFMEVLRYGIPTGLVLYYGGVLIMQFLAGACWAMTGMAFSAFCPNVLLTLCVPLAAYRFSLELYYWLELPYWLNLPLLQDCTVELSFAGTLLAGLLVFGGLTLILCAAFCLRVKRRLDYA